MTNQRQSAGVTGVECDSPLGQLARMHHRFDRIPRPGLSDQEQVPIDTPRKRCHVARVHSHRSREQFSCGKESGSFKSVYCGNSTQCEVKRRCFSWFTQHSTLAFVQEQFGVDLGRCLASNLALDRQDIIHFPVAMKRPDHLATGMKVQ